MSNQENLNIALNAFYQADKASKEGTSEKKSLGATIAETIVKAFKENDLETIKYIEEQRQAKNETFKVAKAYVSKGVKVGKAFESGMFNADNNQSYATLYDLIQKAEKEKPSKADKEKAQEKESGEETTSTR